jgi:hypothetical protein
VNLMADECIDRQIVDRLREEGHEVLYVADMLFIPKDFGNYLFSFFWCYPRRALLDHPGDTDSPLTFGLWFSKNSFKCVAF